MPSKILISLVFASLSLPAFARVDVSDDRMAARKILNSVEKHSFFRTEKCKRVGMAWVGFFILKRPIHHRYQFAPGCDVDGTVEITPEPFLVHFKVRNLGEVTYVTATCAVTVDMNGSSGAGLTLKFDFSNGLLKNKSGSELIGFDGSYTWSLEKNAETEHHGQSGRLHVSSYKGRPLDLNEELEPALFH